tara:strand:- start:9373 stop:9570 length:198 start_codon:yes stop_codon:yes gene_type:complete
MMEIKEGALVKAWDDDVSDFIIGRYEFYQPTGGYYHVVDNQGAEPFINAIEIPADLAKQLDQLGR